MKKLIIISISLFLIINILSFVNISFSSGLRTDISGKKGSRVIHFYDTSTNKELKYDDVMNNYEINRYFDYNEDNENIYFYNGKEITEDEYNIGYNNELAMERKNNYGDIAYRVKTTDDVKKTVDSLFNNYKIGKFYLEYSPYDKIDWNNVKNYLKNKYQTQVYNQNYYSYSLKGEFEPYRYNEVLVNTGIPYEYMIDTSLIRITKDQKEIADSFINQLIPFLQGDGSDYQKILAAYTYITSTTHYLPDDYSITNMLESNTSIYSVFINQKSVCIGYSIAFNYLMDKLGIESYIVDQTTIVNKAENQFESSHTYNIVKLEDKWYVVDTTSKVFLSGVASNALYNNDLNISNISYNTKNKPTTYEINYNEINSILNNIKNTKTTTTAYVSTTTTKKVLNNESNKIEKKTNNIIVIIVFSVISIIFILVFIIYLIKQKRNIK